VRYCLALCVIDCRKIVDIDVAGGQRFALVNGHEPACLRKFPPARNPERVDRRVGDEPGDHSLAELRARRIGIIDLQPRYLQQLSSAILTNMKSLYQALAGWFDW
jgi:hypothetical protein